MSRDDAMAVATRVVLLVAFFVWVFWLGYTVTTGDVITAIVLAVAAFQWLFGGVNLDTVLAAITGLSAMAAMAALLRFLSHHWSILMDWFWNR